MVDSDSQAHHLTDNSQSSEQMLFFLHHMAFLYSMSTCRLTSYGIKSVRMDFVFTDSFNL